MSVPFRRVAFPAKHLWRATHISLELVIFSLFCARPTWDMNWSMLKPSTLAIRAITRLLNPIGFSWREAGAMEQAETLRAGESAFRYSARYTASRPFFSSKDCLNLHLPTAYSSGDRGASFSLEIVQVRSCCGLTCFRCTWPYENWSLAHCSTQPRIAAAPP